MNRKKPPVSNAINSAALQDHIIRQYSLDAGLPKRTNFSRHAKSILKIAANDEITKKQIQYDNKLTLAQRLGLVAKPDAPLSHAQWAQVEKASETREEYKGHCPICQEFLGREPTVILSCTHVFHKLCISSFEKFSKTKACPICRKQSYEKKNYKTSQDYYYIYCITKIQAWIRGYFCRKRFIKHILSHPSSNVHVNRKYTEMHMARLNFKLNLHLDKKESNLDKLFLDLENKLLASQTAVSALKKLTRPTQSEVSDSNWEEIKRKAAVRCDKQCPICLQDLRGRRESSVLSCSHVFHTKCVESFEIFSINTPNCPVCRAEYTRVKFL
jgi:Ring finger domain/IQ calmodulin-binding motif